MSDTSDKKTRVNDSGVAGINIATSRARFWFNDKGINKVYNDMIKTLEDAEAKGVKYEELPCLDEVKDYLAKYEELLKRNPEASENSDREQRRETFTKADLYGKAKIAIKAAKYRISKPAIVAVASILDIIANECSAHAVRQTAKNERVNILKEFLLEDIDKLPSYNLFCHLTRYQQFVNSAGKSDEKEPVEPSLVEEKSPRKQLDFTHYINTIAREYVSHTDKGATTRVTKKFKTLLSDMLCEFVSQRCVTVMKIIVQKAKTIREHQILTALELMLIDTPEQFRQQILKIVEEKVENWHKFDELRKEHTSLTSGKNKDKFIKEAEALAEKMQNFEMPAKFRVSLADPTTVPTEEKLGTKRLSEKDDTEEPKKTKAKKPKKAKSADETSTPAKRGRRSKKVTPTDASETTSPSSDSAPVVTESEPEPAKKSKKSKKPKSSDGESSKSEKKPKAEKKAKKPKAEKPAKTEKKAKKPKAEKPAKAEKKAKKVPEPLSSDDETASHSDSSDE